MARPSTLLPRRRVPDIECCCWECHDYFAPNRDQLRKAQAEPPEPVFCGRQCSNRWKGKMRIGLVYSRHGQARHRAGPGTRGKDMRTRQSGSGLSARPPWRQTSSEKGPL